MEALFGGQFLWLVWYVTSSKIEGQKLGYLE